MKSIVVLGWILLSGPGVFAQDAANKAVKVDASKLQYPVLMQPSFEKSASSETAIGAKTTVFTPLKANSTGKKPAGPLEPLSKEEFAKLGIGMDNWLERAGKEMEAVLAQLHPRFEQSGTDEKPAYAVLEWDNPLAPSLIFAPSFADLFRKELGKSLLIAIPDQSHIYVFPGDAVKMSEFLETLQLTFKNSSTSVSNELFLFRKDDIRPRAIGSFASPED